MEDDKKSKKTDIEELSQVLSVVGDKIPKLISDIIDSIYNKQNAEEFSRSVAQFYKNMKESGMSDEKATELTEKFMESRDIASLLKKVLSDSDMFSGKFRHGKKKDEEDEEEEIEEE